MSPITLINRRPARAAVVVALSVALAAVAWIVGPQKAESVAPAAVPNSERIGTLTFSGFSDQTVDLRAFSFAATATPCSGTGGPGCAGKANLGEPAVTLDSGPTSPLELETLVTGAHMRELTVVLFKPYTTKRSQEYVFEDATFTSIQTGTSAPNNDEPKESLTWAYRKVTHRVYNPGTATVISETCWDIAQNKKC